jgi:hypothetical protein
MKKLQKTPFEKFKNSMKRAGYDMDAGAKRLQDLLDKQKKEREEREMNSTKSEEASPMIKPPKNEFDKKEDAFAHAKQHGGKVMKKTFIHPTSGMKTVSYVVKEETELDEASKKPNATTRFLRQYPVSDKEMAKPVKQSEYQHHVVSKLDGNVLASYKSREAAHRNAYGNSVVSGSLETIGDRKYVREQGVAEGSGKNVVKSVKVGNFRHDLVDTGMGWQVRIYNGDELHDTGMSKNSKQKGLAALEDAVAYTEKQTRTKRQGVAEATVDIADIEKKKNISPKVRESVFKSEIDEAGPFSYGAKPPRKGSVAYNALMKRKEQDKNRVKEIEAIGTKNHHVGVAKVTKEEIEDVTEANDDMYKYIDQSGGQVIKGKSGTYVGYTHSATKGKGANILKHNDTKKYYAAGGSSTAFTQKTTLHDTPQAAAKAYHKGNLAEELNYGKSFKDLREAAFNSNCCADEDYGFTEEQFTVTGNEQYEDWGDDIVEGKLSFSKLSQKLQEEDNKNVKLNKPFLTPGGPKKRAVYVKNDKGNTVKVNFGDPNLEIKRDDPERKSSFRARHNCDNPGPKWKARYWSCKFWSSTPVSKL